MKAHKEILMEQQFQQVHEKKSNLYRSAPVNSILCSHSAKIIDKHYSALLSPLSEWSDTFLASTLSLIALNFQNYPENRPSLTNTITSEELRKSIFSMPNNKSPGSDGYPIRFYKHFWQLISPLFNRMVNKIKSSGTIPTHKNTALLSVLLKLDKDPTFTSSYRPIRLINCDLKIISKALAHRLETVTSP